MGYSMVCLADDLADGADAAHGVVELVGGEGLSAVGPCAAGLVVDFDLQTVGAAGGRRERHGLNVAGVAGGVAGVGNDGQVRLGGAAPARR